MAESIWLIERLKLVTWEIFCNDFFTTKELAEKEMATIQQFYKMEQLRIKEYISKEN